MKDFDQKKRAFEVGFKTIDLKRLCFQFEVPLDRYLALVYLRAAE